MESRLTIGEVFRSAKAEFLSRFGSLTPAYQKRALSAISLCQTPELGGSIKECDTCHHKELHYKSCYQRGCPNCEGSKDALWMQQRLKDLLPVHYFHIVFTVPHILNELFLNNQKVGYGLFFDAVRDTLVTVGKNRFQAEVGFFAVMHTWGQKLNFHPHIHCVVPGGALIKDTWIHSSKKQRYFASHKVLALVFRGILLKKLKRAYAKKKLKYDGDLNLLLDSSVTRKWVVHCKPPFDGPVRVIQYLARYTRKVALSNSRLLEFKNDKVSFSWNDYSHNGTPKIASLPKLEFVRRFLSHIPLPRFIRIRHYGFLSNCKRQKAVELIRELIAEPLPDPVQLSTLKDSFRPGICKVCKLGKMLIIAVEPQTIWNSS